MNRDGAPRMWRLFLGPAVAAVFIIMMVVVIVVTVESRDAGTDPTGPHGDRGTSVTETHLPDGTRCAVMDSPHGVALDCDWSRP